MSRKRLSGEERRESIIDAAIGVFARDGYNGARTQDIAKAAKVSEALVFRHFQSKAALYRAVLRRMIRLQDETFHVLSGMSPDTRGLIDMLCRTFHMSLAGKGAIHSEGAFILFSSLAADGSYASLAYRRSMRLWFEPFELAMQKAREVGDIQGKLMSALNAFSLLRPWYRPY